MYFSRKINTSAIGITEIAAAAITSPHMIICSPISEDIPTVIVHLSGFVINVLANRNSLHPRIAEYVAVAAIPGVASGKMTFRTA